MELNQVALDTGQHQRCTPDGATEQLVEEIRDWLLDLVWIQRIDSLPPHWPGYRANATDFGGGLVVTVYGEGDARPLLTIGVARRASHGSPLWRVLTALPRSMPGLSAPRTPWCGVLDHGGDSGGGGGGGGAGLQSFIRAAAWVWVQRPLPSRRSAPRAIAGIPRTSVVATSS